MTKNVLAIQIISTKLTDKQADRILLLGQVTEKKEKNHPSHFFKISFCLPTSGTFNFALPANQLFAKPKEPLFCLRTDRNTYFGKLYFDN